MNYRATLSRYNDKGHMATIAAVEVRAKRSRPQNTKEQP